MDSGVNGAPWSCVPWWPCWAPIEQAAGSQNWSLLSCYWAGPVTSRPPSSRQSKFIFRGALTYILAEQDSHTECLCCCGLGFLQRLASQPSQFTWRGVPGFPFPGAGQKR